MAIHLLEQEGIDVKNFDEDGRAALHYAACHDKNSECLDVFLAQSDVTRREVNKWNKVELVKITGRNLARRGDFPTL